MTYKVFNEDCVHYMECLNTEKFDLTFLDPPFNQGKDYMKCNDTLNPDVYWDWINYICKLVYKNTSKGGAIYFMHREKNIEYVMYALRNAGWTFQNLIIWKKKTSAVPSPNRYGKHHQVIVFATKGNKPRVFNKIRIDPPLLTTQKIPRKNGVFVTDVWDDIRELTSGFYAGKEPLRLDSGERSHKQQSPVKLVMRMILSSSNVGDMVFDPFAGTGTMAICADQLQRDSISVDNATFNVSLIENRLSELRECDNIGNFRNEYSFTKNIDEIFPESTNEPGYQIPLNPDEN